MFGSFGINLEPIQFYLEMWTGDHKQSGNQSMPEVFAIQQMNQLAYEVLQDSAPRKLFVSYDTFTEDGKVDKKEIAVTNKAWDNSHKEESTND